MSVSFPKYNSYEESIKNNGRFAEFVKNTEAERSRKSTCSICKKNGGTVGFFTSTSPVAHNDCYQSIKPIADRLTEIVNDSLSIRELGLITLRTVHVTATQAVEQVIDPKTLSSYLSENGMDALMNLFNTVGRDAARAAVISSEESASSENEINSLMNLFNAFEVGSPEKNPSSYTK